MATSGRPSSHSSTSSRRCTQSPVRAASMASRLSAPMTAASGAPIGVESTPNHDADVGRCHDDLERRLGDGEQHAVGLDRAWDVDRLGRAVVEVDRRRPGLRHRDRPGERAPNTASAVVGRRVDVGAMSSAGRGPRSGTATSATARRNRRPGRSASGVVAPSTVVTWAAISAPPSVAPSVTYSAPSAAAGPSIGGTAIGGGNGRPRRAEVGPQRRDLAPLIELDDRCRRGSAGRRRRPARAARRRWPSSRARRRSDRDRAPARAGRAGARAPDGRQLCGVAGRASGRWCVRRPASTQAIGVPWRMIERQVDITTPRRRDDHLHLPPRARRPVPGGAVPDGRARASGRRCTTWPSRLATRRLLRDAAVPVLPRRAVPRVRGERRGHARPPRADGDGDPDRDPGRRRGAARRSPRPTRRPATARSALSGSA